MHASVSAISAASRSSRSAERAWVCQRSERGRRPTRVPQPRQVERVEQSPSAAATSAPIGRDSARRARRCRTRCAATATSPNARRARSGTPAASAPLRTARRRAIRPLSTSSSDAASKPDAAGTSTAVGDVDRRATVAEQPQRRHARSSAGSRGTGRAGCRASPLLIELVDLGPRSLRTRRPRGRHDHARVTSNTDAPVSSVMRWSNEIPDRLTIWLTTASR